MAARICCRRALLIRRVNRMKYIYSLDCQMQFGSFQFQADIILFYYQKKEIGEKKGPETYRYMPDHFIAFDFIFYMCIILPTHTHSHTSCAHTHKGFHFIFQLMLFLALHAFYLYLLNFTLFALFLRFFPLFLLFCFCFMQMILQLFGVVFVLLLHLLLL